MIADGYLSLESYPGHRVAGEVGVFVLDWRDGRSVCLLNRITEEKRVQNTMGCSWYELITEGYWLSYGISARTIAAEVVQALRRLMRRLPGWHGERDGVPQAESLLSELIADYSDPEG